MNQHHTKLHIQELVDLLGRIEAGDYAKRIENCAAYGSLEPLAARINSLAASLQNRTPIDRSYESVLNFVADLANLNFGHQLELTGDDAFDGLVTGLNMLSEELEHSVASKAELERQQNFLKSIFDGSPYPIFTKDIHGRFTHCNAAFAKLAGKSMPSQVIGKFVHDLYADDIGTSIIPRNAPLFSTHEIIRIELLVPTSSGYRWHESTTFPVIDEKGEVSELGCILVDIHDAKLATKRLDEYLTALQESKKQLLREKIKFTSLINGLDQTALVAVTDKAGTIRLVNDRFCQTTGYSREELVGANPRVLKSGYHDADFYKTMYRSLTQGQGWHGEFCNRRKDGSTYWVDATITEIPTETGQKEYMAISFDITAKNEAIKKLVSSSKMSTLGEMAGGIAHEINNPMTIILGKVQVLQARLEKPPFDLKKAAEDLAKIRATGERITKIVRGLRSFSRNADQDPTEPTDLGTIIDNVTSLCAERFKNNNVRLEVNSAPGLKLNCRGVQIEQVLVNLLNNAFDAIATRDEKWVRLDLSAKDDRIHIVVTDCGDGIPANVVEKLMQPFFTTKEVGKGTGLGLSISKGIIEDHHGHFYYDPSCPNTRFVIELPASRQEPKPVAS